MKKTVLIIGITGGYGNATAKCLAERGWNIRAMHRNPHKVAAQTHLDFEISWHRGDASISDDTCQAAKGVDVIVHAANPPGYKNWQGIALPMLKNSIKAASQTGALLVFPGNIYNYNPVAHPVINEKTPQIPVTNKGMIRVQMETMLREYAAPENKVLILRAGDFFGTNAPGSWFQGALVKPGKKVAAVTYPGVHSVGHAWAYLPDLGETTAMLLERADELASFEAFHFRGHYFKRGADFADAIKSAASVNNAPTKQLPWLALKLGAPFLSLFREILEMRYLWQQDLMLENSKLIDFLGAEPHTPLAVALRDTLKGLKCL